MKTLVVLLASLLTMCLVFILINYFQDNRRDMQEINEISSIIESIKISMRESYNINGKMIPNLEIPDLTGKSNKLLSLINNKMTLIVLYSDISCNVCVDELFTNCSLLNKKYKNLNIIVIASTRNKANLLKFKKINKINNIILDDNKYEFKNSLAIISIPTMILVKPNGTITNSFFINPNIKFLSKTFFNYVEKEMQVNIKSEEEI